MDRTIIPLLLKCPASSPLRKHLRLHKVFCNIYITNLILFLHQLHLFSIKSCILSICYDQVIESILTDTHNILFYGLTLKIVIFIPTPDFPHFYYMYICVIGYRYIAHLYMYCLAVQAGFYSDMVECSLSTRENLVQSPSGKKEFFFTCYIWRPT